MIEAAAEDHGARERLQRVLYLAAGVGAMVFGVLLVPGDGGIIAQHDQLWPPFAIAAELIAVVIPASFVLLAFILPLKVMQILGATIAIGFVALQLAWGFAMTDAVLVGDVPSWLQGVTALHATIAAIVWQSRWVWLYGAAQGPIVAITQIFTREDSVRTAILDGMGGMLFSLILMGVAIAVITAADRQDTAAARARGHASIEASRRTREREQSRINAIVHDDIMSVLLSASRANAPAALVEQAQVALASIEALSVGDPEDRDYAPEEIIAVLRSAVSETAAHVDFTYELNGTKTVTAPVMAAFTEALGEAMRNSVLHGSRTDTEVNRKVRVAVSDASISVVARDDGPGFSMRGVPERRLGIRVSIVERMRSLDGGNGSVWSRPGRGTTVTLTWDRP